MFRLVFKYCDEQRFNECHWKTLEIVTHIRRNIGSVLESDNIFILISERNFNNVKVLDTMYCIDSVGSTISLCGGGR
nr:hypothetical protein BgiMline_020559 [Biomphalaria glabrata]